MNIQLFVHNIFFLLGGLINVGIAIMVFFSTRHKRNITVTTFALSSIAVSVFQFSHLLGVNAPTAELSRSILMFNLSDIFIGIFMTHWFLGLIGKEKTQIIALRTVYVTGLGILTACLIWPRMFLVTSVPKLYLPYYYEPGPLYYVMFFWFLVVSIYHFSQLIIAYRQEKDQLSKNRYKYILYAMVYAYIFGTTAFLLVFDIPFNPALSAIFGFYPLVIVYAILQYEVFDIRIFAKKAFVYAAVITLIGATVTLNNVLSNYLVGTFNNVPTWFNSFFTSLLLGGGGVYVWRKARQADIAKYEFITVVTHKFRTPLTRIRWATEEIEKNIPTEKKQFADIIFQSERQLLELTNILSQLSNGDSSGFIYRPTSLRIQQIFDKMKPDYMIEMKEKHIKIEFNIPEDFVIFADEEKVAPVLEIILNNALNYTPVGGTVYIRAYIDADSMNGIIEIRDNGIGMSKDTLSQMFTRFYRGDKARLADTEGLGIGLFVAKSIIEKQHGRIWAHSEGEGKGSSFFVKLPLFSK